MEDEKEACKIWRCYTGKAKMDSDGEDHKEAVTKWIDVAHTQERCYSGISSMKISYDEREFGGSMTDVELKEDRLFIFRARVFHEVSFYLDLLLLPFFSFSHLSHTRA